MKYRSLSLERFTCSFVKTSFPCGEVECRSDNPEVGGSKPPGVADVPYGTKCLNQFRNELVYFIPHASYATSRSPALQALVSSLLLSRRGL